MSLLPFGVHSRLPCSPPPPNLRVLHHFWDAIDYLVGALKATNNRGLQPAMDHLVDNEGKPVPDLSSVSSTETSTRPAGGGDPMDEDEDLEALRAVYGSGANASSLAQAETDAEAKVRMSIHSSCASLLKVSFPS